MRKIELRAGLAQIKHNNVIRSTRSILDVRVKVEGRQAFDGVPGVVAGHYHGEACGEVGEVGFCEVLFDAEAELVVYMAQGEPEVVGGGAVG